MKKQLFNPANGFTLKDKFLEQSGKSASIPPVKEEEKANSESKTKKGIGKDNGADTNEKNGSKEYTWDRWTIICSIEIQSKIKAISEKEQFSIREVIEKFLGDGIDAYEAKHGKIRAKSRKKKDINSLI